MEILVDSVKFIFWFVLTFVAGSFVEYWAHRMMHVFPQLCQYHVGHHQGNTGQGVLGEFRDCALGTSPLMGPMFFFSWRIGLSCLLGGLAYAAFAAYAHQVQHDNPTKCIWMKMPVHYVHHTYDQWHHNFGLGVDWWDRVFNTYYPVEWLTTVAPDEPERGYFQIRWR